MSAAVKVADLQPGMVIHRGPYHGAIESIFDHGRTIGDGTVDWRTLRIHNQSRFTGQPQPFTTTVGPLRVDAEIDADSDA